MQGDTSQPTTVDEYIAQFPEDVRAILTNIRALIKELVPEATERIAYGMPGYYLNGPLVYFAGFKRHVSVFPAGSAMGTFTEDLTPYKASKGTLQFRLDKPIPYDLIGKVVKFRMGENQEKTGEKSQYASRARGRQSSARQT